MLLTAKIYKGNSMPQLHFAFEQCTDCRVNSNLLVASDAVLNFYNKPSLYKRVLFLQVHDNFCDNFWQRKAFKNDKKCFLFHLKRSFCSEENLLFVLTFSSFHHLIREIRLISKFMASQTG